MQREEGRALIPWQWWRARCIKRNLGCALVLSAACGGAFFLGMHATTQSSPFAETQRGHLARLDGASVQGRVVFLGSSTFQGLDVSAVTPYGLNLSMGGDTLPSLTERTAGYRAVRVARAVWVNIGLNDVMHGCELPSARLDALFQFIPQPIPIFVLGAQAVDHAQLGSRCAGRLVQLVTELNADFARACIARPGCIFVHHPVAPVDSSPDAAILREGDGIHLSPAGYARLSARLRKALAEASVTFVAASMHDEEPQR